MSARILRRCLLLAVCCTVAPSWADEVVMAFGEKIPPYCFPESNSGIELDVIGEALAYRGHTLIPVYYPLARVPVSFRQGKVDAAMTDLGQDLSDSGAFYGDSAVVYDNVLITLKSSNLKLNTPEDLAGLRIVAFQGAVQRYPEWLEKAQRDHLYFEQNNQELQVLGLNKQRYEVVLSDRSIYRYFELQLERTALFHAKDVEMHEFVKVNPQDYRPVFRNEQIRDDFNEGLRHLKETGRFQAIYDNYLKN
jgi:polar amino acid transport system substrate-binding protein